MQNCSPVLLIGRLYRTKIHNRTAAITFVITYSPFICQELLCIGPNAHKSIQNPVVRLPEDLCPSLYPQFNSFKFFVHFPWTL